MEILTIVVLGIIMGTFFSLDLFISEKSKGAFTRQFINIVIISIPAIYQAVSGSLTESSRNFPYLWINFFYISYLLSLFLSIYFVYLLIYKPLVKNINNARNIEFTFFDFLFKGYSIFKKSIDIVKLEIETKKKSESPSLIHVQDEIREDLLKYIRDLYSTISDSELDGYLGYALYTFVEKFMGSTDARFTIRVLNFDTNHMETHLTTRDDAKPGSIPLSKKNLITESVKQKRPIIYSESKNVHYNTKSNSIKRGIYEDYVSYCLLKTHDNKPYYSLCLDVKGDKATSRMKAIVHSLLFEVICNAITMKLLLEIEKTQTQNEH